MKVLDLVLKKEWFDLIKNGDKREEYREIKPYWFKRLFNVINSKFIHNEKVDKECADFYCDKNNLAHLKSDMGDGGIQKKGFTHVRFRRGYTNNSMLFRINDITIGKGKSQWGGSEHETFIIKFADKQLKEEIAPLFDKIIQEHLNEFYINGQIDLTKLTEIYTNKVMELFCDYNMKFISNNNINNFVLKGADEYTNNLLNQLTEKQMDKT